jgi:hypothetical protein
VATIKSGLGPQSKVIYNVGMKKPGRKNEWDESLGLGVKRSPRFPKAVHDLIREKEVHRLLNRMVMDPDFKIQVLGMIDKP